MSHQYSMALLLVLAFCLIAEIKCQSQNAIGAHRNFQKTSFSCSGRPAGYYADIETGCQVYHMCDGLGRQFSYSCPNTTLFQQRMLICDHWYMVNCSKAESHYTANLLIGQRDKPFVNDEENNLRTPRPDLLDRPYAPDYSGESFRNQYKQLPATQNQIHDNTKKQLTKVSDTLQNTGQTRWKIPPPSRTILPPAYEPQIEESTKQTPTTTTARYVKDHTATTRITTRTTTRTTTTTVRPKDKLKTNNYGNAALYSRKQEQFVADQDDLGTSHSTRYNSSADFNSAEEQMIKTNNIFGKRKIPINETVKVPSKIYEPPFVFPIYNENDTMSTNKNSVRLSTSAPFTASTTTTSSRSKTLSTTRRPQNELTTLAGKAFAQNTRKESNQNELRPKQTQQNDLQQKNTKDARTPTPAQGFKSATVRPQINTPTNLNALPGTGYSELPHNDLLPPYVEFVLHDVATTQGPPIYYEWKVPSDGLEPPKLDPPYGVDGREYTDTVIDYNAIFAKSGAATQKPIENINNKFTQNTFAANPFLAAAANTKPTPISKPTSRSIIETAQPNNNNIKIIANKAQRRSDNDTPTDITDIRKELLVPDYAFPLETIGRTGYSAADTYNSFQLKIPERKSDTNLQQHWFGENPKCPECHPSYVKPGTCEPCLRR